MTVKHSMVFCLLVFDSALSAASAQDTTVQLGSYELNVSSERIAGLTINREVVGCESVSIREFYLERESSISTTASKSLKETLAVEAKAKVGASGVLGEISTALTTSTATDTIMDSTRLKSITSQIIRPLRCYNQHVRIVFDQEIHKITGIKAGLIYRRDPIDPFDVVKETINGFHVVARYNEGCHRACKFSEGLEPLVDENGQQLYAIFNSKNYTYSLPVYWSSDWTIVNIIDKLPEYVRQEFDQKVAVTTQEKVLSETVSTTN